MFEMKRDLAKYRWQTRLVMRRHRVSGLTPLLSRDIWTEAELGDRAAELLLTPEWKECPHHTEGPMPTYGWVCPFGCGAFIEDQPTKWTEAELRAAWGDR